MRRRDLIAMTGCAAVALPFVAEAETPALPVVGYVADLTPNPRNVAAVRKGMEEEGFFDGRNVTVEIHTAPGQYDRIHDIVADLVHRRVAVIITEGSRVPLDAARAATSTIPIVAFFAIDPVKDGYVESINRPGGNVTGAVLFSGSANVLNFKRLELLQSLMPRLHTLGLLVGPENVLSETEIGAEQTTMEARGLVVKRANVTGESDLDAAFATLARDGVDALLESPAAFFTAHRADLVGLAAKYRIPASWEWPDFVIIGGLMSYGPSIADAAHQQGVYAGRILRGAKPGDLPVVLPQTFRLFINAKTAETLGLTVPPTLLAIADEVIE